jgi:hypothetical protein
MTDPLTVRAGEKGVVRLFGLDMPPEQARFLREPGAAAQVLGVPDLDPDQVEVFAIADLEGVGLDGYLASGHGIPDPEIAPHRPRLQAVTGWAMVVRSRAFGGKAVQLAPVDGVRLIAAFTEPGTDWSSAGRIETDSARRRGATAPRATRARAQRIGGTVFALVIVIVVAIVWLVAG